MTRRARTIRPAMTLLECVLAVVLLAFVSSAIASAMGFLNGADTRAIRRLGAYEVANRIVLQHLDDSKELEGQDAFPVEYDRFRYRWELEEERVAMDLPEIETVERAAVPLSDRYRIVTVTVYEVDERLSQGAFTVRGEQLAQLTRMFDPFTPRNPDAISRWTQQDIMDRLEEMLGDQMNAAGAALPGGAGGGGGGDDQ